MHNTRSQLFSITNNGTVFAIVHEQGENEYSKTWKAYYSLLRALARGQSLRCTKYQKQSILSQHCERQRNILSPCLGIQQRVQGPLRTERQQSRAENEGAPGGSRASSGALGTDLGLKQQPESQSVWPSPVRRMLPSGKPHVFHRRSSPPVSTMFFRGCKAKLQEKRKAGYVLYQFHFMWNIKDPFNSG